MIPRFLALDAAAAGQELLLSDEEARHLTRVLRLAAGDPICVFDGRGHEFDAIVAHADRREVRVVLGTAREPSAREAGVAVTLAQAVLKGDHMDQVVRDAVMMGVAAIQPIVTSRTELSLAALQRGHRRERWERVAIASAKQCGRAVVPPVHAPVAFDDLPLVSSPAPTGTALMLVEPSAATGATPLTALDGIVPPRATLLVGPEGGWSVDETRQGALGARLVTAGSRTLRADAVALVALAALFTLWKEF